MSKPLYLYIDDERDNSVDAIIEGFNDSGLIEVKLFSGGEDKTFDEIKKLLKEEKFQGLIIDLKLDGDGPERVNFKAPTLAQDLRTSAATGLIPSFPLILCSTEPKMRATYSVDKSSHDLFDYKFLKGADPNWKKFSFKLNSLANGYSWLGESIRAVEDILQRSELLNLDSRIIEHISDKENIPTSHDLSHFVIKQLFNHPGVLIKERTLAARLGIDIDASGEDWQRLLQQLEVAKYKGLYSDGWVRWWSDLINDFFKKISEGRRLPLLNAKERVEIISNHFNLKALIHASPLPFCKSSKFWTICEGHKKPLDPLEGYRIFETGDLKPWQEPKYISFDAAVKRIDRATKGLRPHPSEEERIKLYNESNPAE